MRQSDAALCAFTALLGRYLLDARAIRQRSMRLQNEYDRLAEQFQQDCSGEMIKVPPKLSPKCKDERQEMTATPGIDFKLNAHRNNPRRRHDEILDSRPQSLRRHSECRLRMLNSARGLSTIPRNPHMLLSKSFKGTISTRPLLKLHGTSSEHITSRNGWRACPKTLYTTYTQSWARKNGSFSLVRQHVWQLRDHGSMPRRRAMARQPAAPTSSIPRISQIAGYGSLSPQGQQAIAARGATVDLSDAVNASNLQTIGTIRANSRNVRPTSAT